MPFPRRHLVASTVLAALVLGLLPLLMWAGAPVLFALSSVVLAALGLWNPRLGALALVVLAAPDLVGTAELGRFTLRASQVAALGMCLGVLARELGHGTLRESLRRFPRPLLLMVVFAVIAGVHVALGEVPNPTKGLAYVAWSLFTSLGVAGGLWLVLSTRDDVDLALRSTILAATAIAMFGLLQWLVGALGGDPPLVTQWMEGLPRINGLSYEPSYFAFSMVTVLGLALASFLRRPPLLHPLLAAGCSSVLVISLVLASSRSGWIGLAVITLCALAVIVTGWSRMERVQRRGLGVLASGYALAALLLLISSSDSYARMARRGFDLEEQSSSAPRLEGVRQALGMFRDRPVLGVGLGQFGGALAREHGQVLSPERMDQLVTFNLYAELAAENGLLGLGLVIAALLLVLRACWRLLRSRDPWANARGRALLLAAVVLFGIMYQFNQTLFRTDVWCLIGLVLAARDGKAMETTEQRA
ncbi:MAG: O-antigen ligase family protein [Pseudomonadota bacterium]